MERRKFSREFKLEAVKLIKERGVSVAQASRDLGIRCTQVWDLRKVDFSAFIAMACWLRHRVSAVRLGLSGRSHHAAESYRSTCADPLPDRPHIFRRITSWSISLSKERSATSRFSHCFSSSSCFSLFISDGISPPYFFRQL